MSDHDKKKMNRFVIKVGDTYYLTKGKLWVYDPAEAKDKEEEEGVELMASKFKEEEEKPHTWYKAVNFTDVEFDGVNTGERPGG
ncbi:hypothetical protein [Sphingomicrobium arenosum]|uniref:hypothetical protein n=1 Tax=Sphingomicrobium arenosum TaxID=2233861 RepID=UPI00223F4A04|nr:hypothetical protein [Sphingomicrobium arenosum]